LEYEFIEASRKSESRDDALFATISELSSNLDLDRVLARVLQLATDMANAKRGSIFLLDLQSDELIYRAALGRAKPLAEGGERAPFRRGEGLVGWVIKYRQGVVIGDLDNDPRWVKLPDDSQEHKSALVVPLMANEDALGAMILLSPQYNAFGEDQLRLASAMAVQVGAAINNAELYRLIRDQAERLGGLLRAQKVEATKSRAILESISDGVLVADADGQIILVNAACERTLGVNRAEIVGQSLAEFTSTWDATGRKVTETITQWSLDPNMLRPGEFLAEQLELEKKRILSIHVAPVTTGEECIAHHEVGQTGGEIN
jgi:PAS domain-containing protein